MNIIIVGQGAMGLLWYHHLSQLSKQSQQSHKLSINHLLTIRLVEKNVEYQEATQRYSFTDRKNHTYNNTIDYAQIDDIKKADVVFLCVKSFQISSALTRLISNLKTNSAIILAHNGMGTLTELPKNLASKHSIYTLLTTHGCLRTAPFCITHTGIGSSDLGLLLGKNNLAQQQSLTQVLNTALPKVDYHANIQVKQWLKLAINCVINPLTAINNVSNGQINHPSYQSTIITILEEIIAVAQAEGVMLDLRELIQRVKLVAQATANNSSSMRCDVLANRRSEIDYINGYIHQLGIKHTIATPENTKIWQTVKNVEAKY